MDIYICFLEYEKWKIALDLIRLWHRSKKLLSKLQTK